MAAAAEVPSPMVHRTSSSVDLPEPIRVEAVSVGEALARRRSVRAFTGRALTLAEVATLLWAAQGRTGPEDFRTAPSAGALYPLEIHLAVGKVEGLAPGIYRYVPDRHRLEQVAVGDARGALARAALGQSWIADAPVILVIAAVPSRTAAKYGERSARYIAMEAGHAGQNVYLQAVALGLGTTVVGAFDDGRVKDVARLAADQEPLALYPVGYPKTVPGGPAPR
jgi:SagB-type dehydrogenase family enzyme